MNVPASRPDMTSSAVATDDGIMHFMLRYNVATFTELQDCNRHLESLVHGHKNHQATKQQFLDLIRNEIRLLDECKRVINERKTYPKYHFNDFIMERNNTHIVDEFSKHVFNMFEKMLKRFPVCSVSLKEYINFSLGNKEFTMACKKLLSDITSKYHSDPDIYITVAEFMYEEFFDIEESRRHFSEGLNYYKNDKHLHIEQFTTELQHLDVTKGSTLKFVLFNYHCLKEIYNGQIDFYFILLDKIMLMSQVTDVFEIVISDMFLEFKHSKLMWHKLVQITDKNFIYDTNLQLIFYSYCDYCTIENCISVYNQGLTSNLPYYEWLDLWQMYLDHLRTLKGSYHMKNVKIGKLVDETILDAFETAYSQNALNTVQYYVYWASLRKNSNILLMAQKLIYKQLKLGFDILHHYLGTFIFGEFLNVASIICCPSLLNKTFSLWKIVDTYIHTHNLCLLETIFNHTSYSDDNTMEDIENRCFKEFKKIFSNLYTGTVILKELMGVCPESSIALLSCLIKFHKMFSRIKKAIVRIFAKKLCSTFGCRNIGLWIDYIRFEYTHGSWLYVRKIFDKSFKCLGIDLHDAMREEFNKLREEFESPVIIIDD